MRYLMGSSSRGGRAVWGLPRPVAILPVFLRRGVLWGTNVVCSWQFCEREG